MSEVLAGQIWLEVDPRKERHIRVLQVSADKEIVVIETVVRSSNGWARKPTPPLSESEPIPAPRGFSGAGEL